MGAETAPTTPEEQPKEIKVIKSPDEETNKTKGEAHNIIEHAAEVNKKYPLNKTLSQLEENPNYLQEMSDEEYDALKLSLSSLVGTDVGNIKTLQVNEHPQQRSYVGLNLKNGGFLRIDTNKMIAYSVSGAFTGRKNHEAPLDSEAVKRVIKEGGKLHDYLGEPNTTESTPDSNIPTLESFKDNWGPGQHLLKEISKLGLNAKHVMADRSRGFTGAFKLEDPNDEKIQEVMNSINGKELVQGYTVKLTQRPFNEDFIDYEYREK